MKTLEGYENTFRTAIDSSYARNLGSRAYNALNEIFERITGNKFSGSWGCPHCTIRFMQLLGKLYFDEKQRLASIPAESRTEDVNVSESKRKAGRPRRQATNNEQNK